MTLDDLHSGDEFRFAYPFVRSTFMDFEDDGEGRLQGKERATWKPGIFYQYTSHYGDSDCFANGTGEAILTVISTHKPGKFPARVFFTRRWKDPDGKEFGRHKCHVATLQKFSRLTRGYAYEYKITTDAAEKQAA